MTGDGVTQTMRLEETQRRKREEKRGRRRLGERRKEGERREREEVWVKKLFLLYYFDDGFRDFAPSFKDD